MKFPVFVIRVEHSWSVTSHKYTVPEDLTVSFQKTCCPVHLVLGAVLTNHRHAVESFFGS